MEPTIEERGGWIDFLTDDKNGTSTSVLAGGVQGVASHSESDGTPITTLGLPMAA